MGYGGTLPRIGLRHERSLGLWLGLSALLVIAILVPPLLLPLLLGLSLEPLAAATRGPWIGVPTRGSRALTQPHSPRGPPRS